MMISRRNLLAGSAAAALSLSCRQTKIGGRGGGALAASDALSELERSRGGRLGVAVIDASGRTLASHRGGERFALCSTFKALAVGLVLARADRGDESLGRRVAYGRDQLVAYSPVTEKHAGTGGGMIVGGLCDAAVTLSDNTAGNLLLDSFGGPAALTIYLRSLGDEVTRLDRREPELNDVAPGDPRDTTAPLAMAETLRKLVLGGALSGASREQLAAWLVACETGGKRLRAGVPADWRVGDKTGTGPAGEACDVAVLWPPGRRPAVVAAYYNATNATPAERDAVLAEVGRLAASAA